MERNATEPSEEHARRKKTSGELNVMTNCEESRREEAREPNKLKKRQRSPTDEEIAGRAIDNY